MADTLIGIRGADFVAVACDTYEKYSIITIKNDDEGKIMKIGTSKVMMLAGPLADRSQFGERIGKILDYKKYKNSQEFSTTATAHFVRLELSHYLRQCPYHVDMLIAGVDQVSKPSRWAEQANTAAPSRGQRNRADTRIISHYLTYSSGRAQALLDRLLGQLHSC